MKKLMKISLIVIMFLGLGIIGTGCKKDKNCEAISENYSKMCTYNGIVDGDYNDPGCIKAKKKAEENDCLLVLK